MSEKTESASADKPEGEVKVYASLSDTLRFIWPCGFGTQIIFCLGIIGGIGNGLVYPALAFVFSTSFSSISSAGVSGGDPMAEIREVAYTFMVVGAFALVFATLQTFCFEVVSHRASREFRKQWFHSLLRQDTAFFDVHDVGGIAAGVGPRAIKYKRGIGKKFGDGIQFLTTGVGGIGYGFYASWRVAFLVLSFLPVISIVSMQVVTLNQTKSARAAKHYTRAGSVAYSTVSSIKTVNALNAIPQMIRQYTESTNAAMSAAVSALPMEGFYNGAMLGSFMVVYGMLVLFGTFLLYKDVEDTGCDPSDSIPNNETCENSGVDVFGAMLGVMFAAQGVSQVGNCTEAFSEARVAAYEAMKAISRMPGSPEEKIMAEGDDLGSSKHTADMEAVEDEGPNNKVKAILPKYEINAFAEDGAKPENGAGAIEFKDVMFSYPTRPGNPILQGLSLKIEAGKTIALVGPSGGGKSTVVSMIERFYDPISGAVELDGTNLKDINVSYLRKLIGYVGQEPTLFGTTIRGNIAYGRPDATQEEIEAAAKMANAHDFISSFPDGYDTQVGDKGSQLSGGQKQRIAIARVLVGNTKILLLDEATSALDSESELVVQDALDNVLEHQKMTTVIIAHRLSTIRNADMIAVVVGGKIVETGSHGDLMVAETGYYRNLVEKQEGRHEESNSFASSRNSSASDLEELGKEKDPELDLDSYDKAQLNFNGIHFAYPSRPEKKIFDNFHLAVESGETVALVGPSGGGKSTTVALVERFYDPAEGSLEYMGHDIRSLNLHWYRDQIGYVGQEPILFNDSIAKNIAYGAPGCAQEDIELAARQANAHSFISSFPEGFDTQVGERGTQLSGGQKQRIAIARALVKKPKVLILDEATSALDSESETIVQAALDKLMDSRDHTTLVIAHRLSTIRNADKIAFIADGKVLEYGSHDELISKPHGRYKRLVESQKRGSTMASIGLHKKDEEENYEEEKEEDDTKKEGEEVKEEKSSSLLARARSYAGRESLYLLIGCVGAIFTGGVFPIWGVLFSETIDLLFRGVLPCTDDSIPNPAFSTCEEYWTDFADSMRDRSFVVGTYWAVLLFQCLIGFTLNYVGFGNASERISKRVRDEAFTSLVRQESGYFDMRSVGVITSELQDDAALIQAFSSVPMRQMLVALASVLTGLVLSFVFMWPFALLAMACIPVMGFATSLEMKQFLGEDQGVDGGQDELNSPGGIITETLLNMRTVSALSMEQKRYENYQKAIDESEKDYVKESFSSGFACGMSMFIQQWVNGLQFFWGGWLLNQYSIWGFNDFLISNFALLFSMFGLGAAFQDAADTGVVEKAGKRIFELIDRESAIDPLSEEGKKLS